MSYLKFGLLFALLLTSLFALGCGDDDDDDDTGSSDDDTPIDDDDDATDDDTTDDDTVDDDDDTVDDDDDTVDDDDDTVDDDDDVTDDDDDMIFDPWENPTAKADAFKLYYKERAQRILLAYNRFMLVNDVVPAHTLGGVAIAKSGDTYDVHLHPRDNNDIGFSVFNTYQGYKTFGGRELELTLIRQFEGLAVAEEISGIPGLTCREWQPGFNVTIDGQTGSITRESYGTPVNPAESYSSTLEDEIVDTFFADGVYTYRGDPSESYFTLESILNTDSYAVTKVFEEMPDYLRVSNCCSSFMVSKLGAFAGYFWGNHNSRDNMPDFAMGYFAACEAKDDMSLPADVRNSADRACTSGKNIGDSIVDNGYNLMTVGEFEPYDAAHLIVAGELRPDGTDEGLEWLGSMNSCQMSYMSKAMSSAGLFSPDETVQTPGAYEILAIKTLFELLGLTPPDISKTCHNIDDAYIGLGWGDLLDLQILGMPIWDLLEVLMAWLPDDIINVLELLADAVHQPERAALALVYYAEQAGDKGDLLQESKETLFHIVEIQRICASMMYNWAQAQSPPPQNIINTALEEMDLAAMYAHIGGVGNDTFMPYDFSLNEYDNAGIEGVLTRGDSTLLPLKTDLEIWAAIENELEGYSDRPNTYDRYWARFPTQADMPIHRYGDHYEAVGLDGDFHEIPNISHRWFSGLDLFSALPICSLQPESLDCSWAVLGCERPDLNGDGTADAGDQTLFDTAWSTFGSGAACDSGTGWCDGADLDRSGTLDDEDAEFMTEAQGCWYEL